MSEDPKEKFSARVENYKRFRPSYPDAIIEELKNYIGSDRKLTVADIGSGTGIFTKKLLAADFEVYAVEPNDEMRLVAENDLAKFPNFHSVKGTAEATTLAEESVDLITAAQAFHWFDLKPTLTEFLRISKHEAFIAFIWNERDNTASPFLAEYDALLKELCPKYVESPHREIGKGQILDYIEEISLEEFHFSNQQVFDKEGFIGRALSSSYTPLPDDPSYETFLARINGLFDKYHENGQVTIHYNTHLYLGRIALQMLI
jgi:ubiquinone/menaquinone biosynthesis C-methylase UbiE